MKLEIILTRPIVPRILTPAITKRPEEVVKPLPKYHPSRLADSTEEFCRQVNLSIDRLLDKVDLRTIKEQLKPSIVGIVQQLKKEKITESDTAELRNFLLTNLSRTLNVRFGLSYPLSNVEAPAPSIDIISNRIYLQKFHKTYLIDDLHSQRTKMDSLSSRWPFEFALYLASTDSSFCLKYFGTAVSIDFSFREAILGLAAHLTKYGVKDDALVLVLMLNDKFPNDPALIVILSILYGLIESSKSDEYQAKINQMPKSPYLTAAAQLLDVNDSYLSEMVISRAVAEWTN